MSMIVKTERGEYINIDNLKTFQLEGLFLIVKDDASVKKYTLTEESMDKLKIHLEDEVL